MDFGDNGLRTRLPTASPDLVDLQWVTLFVDPDCISSARGMAARRLFEASVGHRELTMHMGRSIQHTAKMLKVHTLRSPTLPTCSSASNGRTSACRDPAEGALLPVGDLSVLSEKQLAGPLGFAPHLEFDLSP